MYWLLYKFDEGYYWHIYAKKNDEQVFETFVLANHTKRMLKRLSKKWRDCEFKVVREVKNETT